MANIAPTLTPLPTTIKIEVPQINPSRMQKIDIGRKIRKGLNRTAIFNISRIVSMAVYVFTVLFPAMRCWTLTSCSRTRFRCLMNTSVITSLNDMVSGQILMYFWASSVRYNLKPEFKSFIGSGMSRRAKVRMICLPSVR